MSKKITDLANKARKVMAEERIYDPIQLFNRIYYDPEVHHDYRDVRDAIQLAKGQ